MAVTAREASDSPGTSTSDGVSNSLYLFTFLATLLLLVLITSSIILRSLIIRARFRVQQEEVAIARGVPNSAPRVHRRKHRLGEKPKLYNTWITSESDETVGQWHGMMVNALQ
ncbi:hypothetical protein CPB85DRAFT_1431711 [Mucidula mucida]|nr:hypothetical protein CPB85DRAFT_1431711 [Mucidula mucida]